MPLTFLNFIIGEAFLVVFYLYNGFSAKLCSLLIRDFHTLAAYFQNIDALVG